MFIEGINNDILQRDLYHILDDDPDITFFDYREKVCNWYDNKSIPIKTTTKIPSKSNQIAAEPVLSEISAISMEHRKRNHLWQNFFV